MAMRVKTTEDNTPKGKTSSFHPYTKTFKKSLPNPEQIEITVMVIGHGACLRVNPNDPKIFIIKNDYNIKTYSRADVGQDSYGSADPTDPDNARQILLNSITSAHVCPIIPSILADIKSKSSQPSFDSRVPIPERYEFSVIDVNTALSTVADFYNPVNIGIGPIQTDIKKWIPAPLLSYCSKPIPFDVFSGIFNIVNCNSTSESQSGKKVITRTPSILPNPGPYRFDYTSLCSYPENMQLVILEYIKWWNLYVNFKYPAHINFRMNKFYTIVLTVDKTKITRITNESLYHIVCITISNDDLSLAFTSLAEFETLLSHICSSNNIQLNIISLTCRGLVGGKKRKNIYNKMKTRQIRRHRRPSNKRQRRTKRK
jgi:hypothetical protein